MDKPTANQLYVPSLTTYGQIYSLRRWIGTWTLASLGGHLLTTAVIADFSTQPDALGQLIKLCIYASIFFMSGIIMALAMKRWSRQWRTGQWAAGTMLGYFMIMMLWLLRKWDWLGLDSIQPENLDIAVFTILMAFLLSLGQAVGLLKQVPQASFWIVANVIGALISVLLTLLIKAGNSDTAVIVYIVSSVTVYPLITALLWHIRIAHLPLQQELQETLLPPPGSH